MYVVLPLAGAEMCDAIANDFPRIERVGNALDWDPYNYYDSAYRLFNDCMNGDFCGTGQPFNINHPILSSGSVYEYNAPRTQLVPIPSNDAIANSIATWFGTKIDTAVLNYYYVGKAMGERKDSPGYYAAAVGMLTRALLNFNGNLQAKAQAFWEGYDCDSIGKYYETADTVTAELWDLNDSSTKQWMNKMLPNYFSINNYHTRGTAHPIHDMWGPSFMYVPTEEINGTNDCSTINYE